MSEKNHATNYFYIDKDPKIRITLLKKIERKK
jgi:hypothetical protein